MKKVYLLDGGLEGYGSEATHEDKAQLDNLMEEYLTEKGYEVVWVEDGRGTPSPISPVMHRPL